MSQPVSPLAPVSFPTLPPVAGVRLSTRAAGLRYQGRDDLLLVELAPGTVVAGAFTRSLCPSAPVDWCRSLLPNGSARCLVVNSGNANAFTGRQGDDAARAVAEVTAATMGLDSHEVFLASTGVIGEQLPLELLSAEVALLPAHLVESGPAGWTAAAGAIRTTDTFAKGASAVVDLGGEGQASIVGIAKGSGMIAPDMATMLSFVFTDAAISADVAQGMLSRSVTSTYNRITVDSDTSTSDTVLWFATGRLGNEPITDPDDPRIPALQEALDRVNLDLAHQIVRDGEGATKFVEVTVTGAESDEAASIIALAIANSPLVKTALAAEDANWGRIVMAVGKSGQRADRDALAVWIGDEQCAEAGTVRADYREEVAARHLRGPEISLRADVGVGQGRGTVWTCDLTHGYIDINAGYRS